MCGRFGLFASPWLLASTFAAPEPEWAPRYNLAPTQELLVLRASTSGRSWSRATWGFQGSQLLINARGETAAVKPTFRHAWREGRCLLPASGFYEWSGPARARQAHFFAPTDSELWAMAGLVQRTPHGLRGLVLTVAPNELVAPIHDRMPALLPPERWDDWLAADTPGPVLAACMATWPSARMQVRSVGPRVGHAGAEGASLLDPPPPLRQASWLDLGQP